MEIKGNYKSDFNNLSKMIQDIKGLEPNWREVVYQGKNVSGIIKFDASCNLTKTSIENKILEHYKNRGFDVKFIESSYLVDKGEDKYIISVNVKKGELIFALSK